MKYTIEGFQQSELLNLSLDGIDAIILRYVIDFYSSGQMFHKIIDNKVFFWVNFGTIINELPILKIEQTRGISRRFEKFIKCGLMGKNTHKGQDIYLYKGKERKRAGTFTYFTINPDIMENLVREQLEKDPYILNKERHASKGSPSKGASLKEQASSSTPGNTNKAVRVGLKGLTKDSSSIDNSIINNSITDMYKKLLNFKGAEKTEHSDLLLKNLSELFKKEDGTIEFSNNNLMIKHKYVHAFDKKLVNRLIDSIGLWGKVNIFYSEI